MRKFLSNLQLSLYMNFVAAWSNWQKCLSSVLGTYIGAVLDGENLFCLAAAVGA